MSEPDDDEFGTLHNDPDRCPMWHNWCRCTPSNVLIRARELREKRRKAHEDWRAVQSYYWDHSSVANLDATMKAEREWQACVEDFRQFLIAVRASNMDELEKRSNAILRARLPEPAPPGAPGA